MPGILPFSIDITTSSRSADITTRPYSKDTHGHVDYHFQDKVCFLNTHVYMVYGETEIRVLLLRYSKLVSEMWKRVGVIKYFNIICIS